MSARVVSEPGAPLVDVEDLRISFADVNHGAPLVRGLNLQIHPGECVALVGESGSGKSLTARSLLGLAGEHAQVQARRLQIDGRDALRFNLQDWRQLRGRFAGLVMQDALVSLDPLRTIGQETGEVLRTHRMLNEAARGQQVLDTLRQVGIPDPQWRSTQFAHQLSGGLRQRALIAAAIAAGPRLIIADEPTTALDVSVQRQVIAVLAERVAQGAGLLIISHDLNLVAQIADRVHVMHNGEVVDSGSAQQVLTQPRHAYTRQLLAASPGAASRGTRLSSARVRPGVREQDPLVIERDPLPSRLPAEPREVLRVEGIGKSYRRRGFGRQGQAFTALHSASFTLNAGEVLGIVGESGSGKTTCANIVLGLLAPDSGSVHLLGQRWSHVPEAQRRPLRRQMQYIPQDPLSSFDPRYTVAQIIAENLLPGGDDRQQASALLTQVGLNADFLDRHPRSLSGGQRQRIAIARALAAEPALIICDEPVSALDVYVQAQVLDLIGELQASRGIALLFISHDLEVIRHICDRVLVFHQGQLVEQGPVGPLFEAPTHPYTRQLLSAHPAA
ncbi:ABC transporter ATP-binding protein [Pseudomonas sp. F3-2]|uniref:ABC transporter ATP-binding protein n=1 Tax=Pseudomonas sp. F3-2 TaxID=3141539 RepID=UPI00315CECE0